MSLATNAKTLNSFWKNGMSALKRTDIHGDYSWQIYVPHACLHARGDFAPIRRYVEGIDVSSEHLLGNSITHNVSAGISKAHVSDSVRGNEDTNFRNSV